MKYVSHYNLYIKNFKMRHTEIYLKIRQTYILYIYIIYIILL